MTDRQLLTLIETIQRLALLPYPLPEVPASADRLNLAWILGEIAGVASRGLNHPSVKALREGG